MLTKKPPVLKGLQRLHLRNLKISLLRSTRLVRRSNSKHLAVINWSSKKAKIWGTSFTVSHDSDHYLGSILEASFSNDSFSGSLQIDQDTNFTLNPFVIPMINHSYQKLIQNFWTQQPRWTKRRRNSRMTIELKLVKLKANMDKTISSSDRRQIILRMLMLLLTSHQIRRQKSKW